MNKKSRPSFNDTVAAARARAATPVTKNDYLAALATLELQCSRDEDSVSLVEISKMAIAAKVFESMDKMVAAVRVGIQNSAVLKAGQINGIGILTGQVRSPSHIRAAIVAYLVANNGAGVVAVVKTGGESTPTFSPA